MHGRIKDTFDLLLISLEAHQNEYREHSEIWRNIETKAQGAGAIAGIFLAATFSWVRDIPQNFTDFECFLLISSIVLLVSSIISAIFGLKIKKTLFPPIGEMDGGIIRDLLDIKNPVELSVRIPAFFNDQINMWRETNEDLIKHNMKKAKFVWVSQIAILMAACLVAFLSIIEVI